MCVVLCSLTTSSCVTACPSSSLRWKRETRERDDRRRCGGRTKMPTKISGTTLVWTNGTTSHVAVGIIVLLLEKKNCFCVFLTVRSGKISPLTTTGGGGGRKEKERKRLADRARAYRRTRKTRLVVVACAPRARRHVRGRASERNVRYARSN